MPVRLGVVILGKGAAIPCEPRLDSHRHIDSERDRTTRVAHWLLRAIVQVGLASFALLLEPFMKYAG